MSLKFFILNFLIVGIICFAGLPHAEAVETSEILTQSTEHDLNCRSGERTHCLVISLAPWDASCKRFVSELFAHFPEALKAHPKAGLAVLIGKSSDKAIDRMGQNLGMPYINDPQGAYHKALGLSNYPSFAVLDSKGRVIRTQKTFQGKGSDHKEAVAHFVKSLLKE